ncbi:MAG: glycosyltransferase family 9 protein [Bacteroidetes bacterium]|nr:glycosyltransferase family 9 protein [Bacteroidota bacterium]
MYPLRILLIQTAFTGDVILATALLESLHKQFPQAKIDFLVRKGNDSLLKDHPFLHTLLVWDKKNQKIRNLLRLTTQIRRNKYDLLVNCQRFFSSGLMAAFSGAKQISGFSKNPLSFLFHHKAPHEIGTEEQLHEIQRNHKLIAHLVSDPPQKPALYPPDMAFEKVKHATPYVCLAPTSVWFTKQWPGEKWAELIRLFPKDLNIFLLGAPADKAACAEIAAKCPDHMVRIMAGKLSLLESAALMKGATMNYVNDSAPTHLASAMDAPVTTIFCSTIPQFGFGPLSGNSHVVETTEKLDCRPCGLHGHSSCPEGHFKCAQILPKTIIQP